MAPNSNLKTATFACGCFWSKEYHFAQIPGVIRTRVGFTGGHTTKPSYKEVCHKQTGHAEAVELRYDPEQVSFTDLLIAFFAMHNATIDRRDRGGQYRSAIFYHDQEQRQAVERSIEQLQGADFEIKTELVKATIFYPAADRHQGYCEVRGMEPKANYGPSSEELRMILG